MRARALATAAVVLLGAGCGSTETARQAPLKPNQRVYTLGAGDRARVPAAGVVCEASQEGGADNLVCRRIGGGRNNVVFYPDSIVVWKDSDDAETDADADSYTWGGRRGLGLYPPRRRVFSLQPRTPGHGDRLNAPAAGTTCTVTREEGQTELACKPMGGGRHRVSILRPAVLIWDVLDGRMAPFVEYDWAPRS